MFWHYLENKKPTCLACIHKKVYPAILKSSKKVFFRTAKPSFGGSLKFRLHGFCKEEVKTSKDGSHLL